MSIDESSRVHDCRRKIAVDDLAILSKFGAQMVSNPDLLDRSVLANVGVGVVGYRRLEGSPQVVDVAVDAEDHLRLHRLGGGREHEVLWVWKNYEHKLLSNTLS